MISAGLKIQPGSREEKIILRTARSLTMKFVIRNWQMFKGRHTKLMLRREQLVGMSDTQINLYLSTIKWNYLNDTFKSRFVKTMGGMRYIGGLIMKESGRSTLTHQDGYSMWSQVFPLRQGSAAHKPEFNVTGTPATTPPRFTPISSPGTSTLNLDRASLTDEQRPLVEKAFVEAIRSAYGKSYSSADEAVKAFSEAGFHWEQGSDSSRTVVLAEFKKKFLRGLYTALRRNRSTMKDLFPGGRVTDSVAKKIYNSLVYPKAAAAQATPAPQQPAQPSTPPASTGGPSGAGAAQGQKEPGGTMTQAIKTKTLAGWESVCGVPENPGEVPYARTMLLHKLKGDANAHAQAQKICTMDEAAQSNYFSATPFSSMPAWLQTAIKGEGVTAAQYRAAWKPTGSSAAPAAAQPAVERPAAPSQPPAESGTKPKAKAAALKRVVEVAAQVSVGSHKSGSTEPYSTQPSDGYVNKSRGYELGFMIKALPLIVGKNVLLGAIFDFSKGWHKDEPTQSDGSSSYGSFQRWAVGIAGEYAIKQGSWGSIGLGVHLGFGQTMIKCGNFGQGGACLDKSTIDFVFGADLVYRKALWSGKSFDIGVMAALGFKAVVGLDKGLGRDWQGEDIISQDIPIYTKNLGIKATGQLGVYVAF